VHLSAARSPRPALKRLDPAEMHGVMPLADRTARVARLAAASGLPLEPPARGGSPQVTRRTLGG